MKRIILMLILFCSFNSSGQNFFYSHNKIASCTLPTITTASITDIIGTTATSGGNVTADGGCTVTARGVCWSTSTNPTTANSFTTNGTGTGAFTSSITGLTCGTLYHVRAYATNSSGTSYGSEIDFTAKYENATNPINYAGNANCSGTPTSFSNLSSLAIAQSMAALWNGGTCINKTQSNFRYITYAVNDYMFYTSVLCRIDVFNGYFLRLNGVNVDGIFSIDITGKITSITAYP